MKIITKKIRVIQMTEEETQEFANLMQQAREGHTSHYAEKQLQDSSYLAVSIVPVDTDFHAVKARKY